MKNTCNLVIVPSPEMQMLSGQELNETCQLLDNFLDNLGQNFPLLSTIKIGQGTSYTDTFKVDILCGLVYKWTC